MDTDFATTQKRYNEFLFAVPSYLKETMQAIDDKQRQVFQDCVISARRIFFTAAGSSMPAALHGVYVLQQEGLPASFLPTGGILGLNKLQSSDLVIVCSQGMNRADAALAVSAVTTRGAQLVVLTANHDTPLTADAALTVYFEPDSEKLFSRPAGVATNIGAFLSIFQPDSQPDACINAWQAGVDKAYVFNKATRYITLASDMMLPSNWNLALALREGCGILAQNFDIETYGHGNYVGDIAYGNYEYLLLSAQSSTEAARAVRRFMPFITNSGIPYKTIEAPFSDAARANLYVLGFIAKSVYLTNEENLYNMNRPKGKEENRYYHELASYEL